MPAKFTYLLSILTVLHLFLPESLRAQNCISAPSGLISWWPGDDYSLDVSGLNHGTLRAGARFGEGKVGRGFSFGGTNDFVEASSLGLNVGLGDFTLEGWLKTTATKSLSAIAMFAPAAPAFYVTGDGSLKVSNAQASSQGGFNDGQFHHFAITRQNGSIIYYKDGAPIGTASFADSISKDRFVIGWDFAGGQGFVGIVDELAFFGRALAGPEIKGIFDAASSGFCRAAAIPQKWRSFFIEAEDFDFGGGEHQAAADRMPYFGGAYAGLSAVAEVDFHDPGGNEYAQYRSAAQGVAVIPTGDYSRDGFDVNPNSRVGYVDEGDWLNYTRSLPLPARTYSLFARLGSAAASNGIRIDQVISGHGTTNQAVVTIGEARGPASGDWGSSRYVPVRDGSGNRAKISLGGPVTLRITSLPGANQDIDFLELVPEESTFDVPCAPVLPGLVARWRGEGNGIDSVSTNAGILKNGVTFAQGKVGQALVFDGVDDYAETPLDAQPSAMPSATWEAWVFPTRPVGRQQMMGTDDGGYDRSVGVEGQFFSVFTGSEDWVPTTISPNQWQHIAVVFSLTNIIFYKNGAPFFLGYAPSGQGTGYKLHLGHNPGFGEFFEGMLDEVGVYNRALSRDEINSIYVTCEPARNPVPCSIALEARLKNGVPQDAYFSDLGISGGAAPYVITVATGTLPPGLAFSDTGILSGVAGQTGDYSFAVQVTDANGCVASQAYQVRISPQFQICTPAPSGLVGWWRGESNAVDQVGYNAGILMNGAGFSAGKVGTAFKLDGIDDYIDLGTNQLHFGTNDFTLEAWIETTSTATYNAILSFDDYNPGVYIKGNGALQLYNAAESAPSALNDGSFHHIAVVRESGAVSYFKDGINIGTTRFDRAINPGRVTLGWSRYSGGEKFPGLLDEIALYNRALSVSEIQGIYRAGSAGKCATNSVECPVLAISPETLQTGNVQVDYAQTLTATNGAAPYNFQLANGQLPGGFALSSTGQLTGKAAAVGTFQFVVSVRDTNGCTGFRGYTLTIKPAEIICPTITLSPANLSEGIIQTTYAANLSAAGGEAPYSFLVTDGRLPNGLTLAANGSITGKPTEVGTFNFGIEARDHQNCPGRQSFTLKVNNAIVLQPRISLDSTNLAFGNVRRGQTNDLFLSVTNVGNTSLQVSSTSSDNARFTVLAGGSFSLAPATGRILTIRFSPTTAGSQSGVITIRSNDPIQPAAVVNVSGLGAVPVLTVITNQYDFGIVTIGQGRELTWPIQNTGTISLNISSNRIVGPFELVAGTAPITLEPGEQTNLTVRFKPVKLGDTYGEFDIYNDDPVRSFFYFLLSGRGGLPDPVLYTEIAGGKLVFSWPAYYTNLTLEASGSAYPASWVGVTNKPVLMTNRLVLTQSFPRNPRFFRLNERPAAPQGEFGLGSPPLSIPPDTQPQFPVEERKEAVITAAEGGQIAMQDGAIFSVPAAGFPQDTKVIIRKLDLRAFTGAFARSVYDVDTGGIHLQKNANLLLPAPAGNPRLDSLHVYRHNQNTGSTELAATVDTTLGMIRAETDSFSDIVVEEEAPVAKSWTVVKNDPFAYKLLDVPFYPQGQTMWCYAASSQMLAKFSGADIEAWDVGRHFGVRLDGGPTPLALYSGNYAALFAEEKIKVLEHRAWVHPPNIYAYLIAQIDAGHPVMTLVQYGAHAVVVVGYDTTGVYVHDPSGHSIVTAGLPKDDTTLGAFHLTWAQWRQALFAEKLGSLVVQLPVPIWTLVLEPIPVPAAPPQSIHLFSAVPLGGNNYTIPFFNSVRTLGKRELKGQFIWDGTTPKGYRFASDPEYGPDNLANSDKLALSVHAHNLSGSTVTLAVRALLDNTKVFENTSVALAPRTTMKEVPIFPDAKPYDLLTGVAGLLSPGWHNLRIELFSGADVLDSIPIDLLIGPAKPEKFRFIEVPEGMRLTWFPNREEVFSKIEYIISVNGVPVGVTAEKQFLHPNGTAANVYTVTARDTVNGLESPASEPAVKLEGIPLYRDADPLITGDVGEFSSITSTSGKIVGSNPKTDAGSTVTVTWPEPPPILSSSDNFSFTVIPRLFGWPAGGDTYTITGAPRLTYSDGDTRFGNGGYILITQGSRVQTIGVSTLYGSSTSGSGVLTNFRINLSKDFFFNAGEAVISWGYKAAP